VAHFVGAYSTGGCGVCSRGIVYVFVDVAQSVLGMAGSAPFKPHGKSSTSGLWCQVYQCRQEGTGNNSTEQSRAEQSG